MKKRKIKKKKKKILWRLWFLGIIFLLLLLSIQTENKIPDKKIVLSEMDIFEGCKDNSSIFKSANCIKRRVDRFFVYNTSNAEKNLSFKQLKDEGGVCSHWARLYCSIGEEFGYYSQNVSIQTSNINITNENNKTKEYNIYHENCFWSDNSGWVLFDQQALFEFKFGTNLSKLINLLEALEENETLGDSQI